MSPEQEQVVMKEWLVQYETGIVIKPYRKSLVGTATGYWLDGRGTIPGRSKRLFSAL
jgi:hypothetical protein